MITWTEEEIEFLIENYSKYGLIYCSKKLNRSKKSIQLKRKKLNIDKQYSIKDIWQEENLIIIINKSKTYLECLRLLGFNNYGSSYNTLKKYIKKYNIDISHFISSSEQIKKLSKKFEMCDIFIENSTYSRNSLKKRLYDENIKERKCELCGQDENWNGKKMSLILDHINGVNNDNRLENLRIVCPNCNATLETHCRGKYKK